MKEIIERLSERKSLLNQMAKQIQNDNSRGGGSCSFRAKVKSQRGQQIGSVQKSWLPEMIKEGLPEMIKLITRDDKGRILHLGLVRQYIAIHSPQGVSCGALHLCHLSHAACSRNTDTYVETLRTFKTLTRYFCRHHLTSVRGFAATWPPWGGTPEQSPGSRHPPLRGGGRRSSYCETSLLNKCYDYPLIADANGTLY